MYKITLADGTVINDIDVNGTTIESHHPIDPSIFDHNLSPVIIELIGEVSPNDLLYYGESFEGYHENMTFEMLECPYTGTWWFLLRDVPKEQLELEKMRSDIEYMSMMMDIDL